jgi:putative ABC transport system substrate-binding protein
VLASTIGLINRDAIIAGAATHRLPAVYTNSTFARSGGLVSYGIDRVHQFQEAGGYIDRILHGEKPADLPVQTPSKFELVINMKTARLLGLDVDPTLLALADEVIE